MKKLFVLLSLIVFSLIFSNTAFAADESVIDEQAMAPETSSQVMKGQMKTTETEVSKTPLHSVWPFQLGNEPYPGDPGTKEPSAIDNVKTDLSVDPKDKDSHRSLPEAD